ncbi:MAG: hypothetical protein ACOVOR_05450 [Rhabdochlamydiaceae bacterium]
MSSISSHTDIITQLKNEYSAGSIYGGQSLSASAHIFRNNGFVGSANVVFITCKDSIVHEAPACIAAPLVNMVAKNLITIGIESQKSQVAPVRFYTPSQLSITTKHLSFGSVDILVEPENAFIVCKKLTLPKHDKEESNDFELIKSWVMNEDCEIETVDPNK